MEHINKFEYSYTAALRRHLLELIGITVGITVLSIIPISMLYGLVSKTIMTSVLFGISAAGFYYQKIIGGLYKTLLIIDSNNRSITIGFIESNNNQPYLSVAYEMKDYKFIENGKDYVIIEGDISHIDEFGKVDDQQARYSIPLLFKNKYEMLSIIKQTSSNISEN